MVTDFRCSQLIHKLAQIPRSINPGVAWSAGSGHFGGVTDDERWMARAIEEAERGVGKTAPNPPVGCVIVRDGTEIGAGWHRRAGRPHAEREAIAAAVETHGPGALRGATAYVTLEPCSTHGRTPPCTDALIEAGIGRAGFACTDPNPAHAGAAVGVLRSAGIEVTAGVLDTQAGRLIRPFAKVLATGLPWVMWKTAMSLDGRLTRPPGEGMWLTGAASRAEVQRLRGEADAMLTSGETVRRDRPRLDLRDLQYLEGRDQPWRVVLTDRPGSLPQDAPLFTDGHRERTLVRPRRDPGSVLRELVSEFGVNTVMLECGGRLAADFAEAGLIDEVVAFMAPVLCGGPVPALGGGGLPEGCGLDGVSFRRLDDDVMMRGVLRNGTLTQDA
jgi:diaminohydroxyphosphoribosylaminopyrimidine deaminase/5-amino-6-(5-phosphoribosylamino)uracil reductase